jgi:hypothetical protein
MTNLTTEHNVETGEIIVRDATPEEIANIENMQAKIKAREDAEAKAAADKLKAHTKLKALGLTADDLKALGF